MDNYIASYPVGNLMAINIPLILSAKREDPELHLHRCIVIQFGQSQNFFWTFLMSVSPCLTVRKLDSGLQLTK